jgi:exopolysaccharide biosynthesis polyprenyl glycosylphosphotransferase
MRVLRHACGARISATKRIDAASGHLQQMAFTWRLSILSERLDDPHLSAGALAVESPVDRVAERRQNAVGLGPGLVLAAVLVTLLSLQDSAWRALTIAGLACGLCLVALYVSARTLPWAVGRSTRAALAAMLGLLAISIGGAWFPWFHIRPWVLIAIAGAAFAVSLLRESQPRRPRILLVGGGDGSNELFADAATHRDRFEVVAIVGELNATAAREGSVQLYPSIADLSHAIEIHRPDLVIVNVKKGRPEVFQALLDRAASGFRVVGLPEWYEHVFGRVPVSQVSPAWFMSLLHLYQRPYTRSAKRSFDILVASIGILLTLPLLAVIALLVRRRVLYRQVRVGEWGRPFTMYKFRTMHEGAEPAGAAYAAIDDPRITRVGRFLRKTRLDELPQLVNVLIGEMSIVGPRPERPEFCALLERVPWWMRRNMVKPGITGWAQINSMYAHDADSAAMKLSYDLWYLRHRSLLIDLIICLKTVPRLVSGAGAR